MAGCILFVRSSLKLLFLRKALPDYSLFFFSGVQGRSVIIFIIIITFNFSQVYCGIIDCLSQLGLL